MKRFCENAHCDNPGCKVVPVSANRPADQQGTMTAQVRLKLPRLSEFLKQGGFVVVAYNRTDPSKGGSYEAWAYRGPLDFGRAAPVVFGVGANVADALEALDTHLRRTSGRSGRVGARRSPSGERVES